MNISERRGREVRIALPTDALRQAEQLMRDIDAGVLPVGESGRLVGMLADPDITITIRAVAEGKAPDACRVREVMSPDIKYVFEDESLDDAARIMDKLQVRRLPVVSRDKRLVGIVSLSDVAIAEKDSAGEALMEVSEPPAERAQTLWMQISDAAW